MKNQTQIDRYKRLIDFINNNFKKEITTEKLESVCFYSYRNINRIFQAIHNESIGQYIKRLRIEKSAEYIKFSKSNISDIALGVGYNDLAIFSKAFKNRFGISPSGYRKNSNKAEVSKNYLLTDHVIPIDKKINYTIEHLPQLKILYLAYRGAYENTAKIKSIWNKLLYYAESNNLINSKTIYLGELLDDDEITEYTNCRYNAAIAIPESVQFHPTGLFNIKNIQPQKYAKFTHIGSDDDSYAFYNRIFTNWMTNIQLELADKPILEFYKNDSEENQVTDIYIPII